MSACRTIGLLLEPFLDGELGAERVLEIEQHLSECENCLARLHLGQAVRSSLRRSLAGDALPSAAFRARLTGALESAREREAETERERTRAAAGRMLGWRSILPLSAAAGVVLAWAATTNERQAEQPRRERTESASKNQASMAPSNVDEVLEELVEHHVSGNPSFTETTLLPEVESEVGVPVRLPNLKQYGARWEGGSVVPMSNRRAASLRYQLAGHRVTLYVYDSSRVALGRPLEPRKVGDQSVYVGYRRGYSIGATEHRGVGYAVATDLNDAETAELVAAVY